MQRAKSTNDLIFRGLVAVVVLAPLPLGSNRPVSWSLLSLLVGMLTMAWGIAVYRGRSFPALTWRQLWPVCLPFGLTLAWAWLQTWSFVPDMWAHPLWAEAAHVLPDPMPGRITLDPALTETAIMRQACYGAVFLLAAQLGRERSRARSGLRAIAIAGLFYALYGLATYVSGAETILWLSKWDYLGDLTSTFVNRNAYGAYAGTGLLCCLALFVNSLRHLWRPGNMGLRDQADIILAESAPYFVAGAFITTALLLSHSRAAMGCSCLALLALLGLLTVAKLIPRRQALWLSGFVMAMVAASIIIGGNATLMRFVASGVTDEIRENIYRLTLDAIGNAPWTGYGLGAFLPTFRLYRDPTLPQNFIIDLAHNVHLELVVDLGIPAAVSFYLSMFALLWRCLRGIFIRRRDQVYPVVGLAVALQLGVHGLVDFGLQMPAIAVTFAFLMGIAFAQSFNTAEKKLAELR